MGHPVHANRHLHVLAPGLPKLVKRVGGDGAGIVAVHAALEFAVVIQRARPARVTLAHSVYPVGIAAGRVRLGQLGEHIAERFFHAGALCRGIRHDAADGIFHTVGVFMHRCVGFGRNDAPHFAHVDHDARLGAREHGGIVPFDIIAHDHAIGVAHDFDFAARAVETIPAQHVIEIVVSQRHGRVRLPPHFFGAVGIAQSDGFVQHAHGGGDARLPVVEQPIHHIIQRIAFHIIVHFDERIVVVAHDEHHQIVLRVVYLKTARLVAQHIQAARLGIGQFRLPGVGVQRHFAQGAHGFRKAQHFAVARVDHGFPRAAVHRVGQVGRGSFVHIDGQFARGARGFFRKRRAFRQVVRAAQVCRKSLRDFRPAQRGLCIYAFQRHAIPARGAHDALRVGQHRCAAIEHRYALVHLPQLIDGFIAQRHGPLQFQIGGALAQP